MDTSNTQYTCMKVSHTQYTYMNNSYSKLTRENYAKAKCTCMKTLNMRARILYMRARIL